MSLRRIIAATAALSFAMAAVVLSLSDRAPLAYRDARRSVMGFVGGVQDRAGVHVLHRADVPLAADQAGHLVLWFCGAVVLGLALRRRADRLVVGLGLVAGSIVLEFLQALVTSTRHLQLGDVVANAAGVSLGLVAIGMLNAVGHHRTSAL